MLRGLTEMFRDLAIVLGAFALLPFVALLTVGYRLIKGRWPC